MKESKQKFNSKATNNSTLNNAGRDINYNYGLNTNSKCWQKINTEFFEKHNKNITKESVLDYILGASCKWGIIANNQTVSREIVNDLIQEINTHSSIQALVGAGGEGKTTILMQVAYRLYKDGWTVFYHTGKTIHIPDEKDFDINKTIFIVDDVVSITGFDIFLSEIIDNEYKMLFSSRSNEWAMYLESNNISLRDIHQVETKAIINKEADAFAEYIVNNSATEMSKDEIRDIFLTQNNGFLYSAMLCSVYGENLEEIAKTIINRIYDQSPDIAQVLACLCLVEEVKHKMSLGIYKKIYGAFRIPKRKIFDCLSKEVKIINNNCVETRHPIISELFRKYLYEEENAYFDKYDIWDLVFKLYCEPSFGERLDKSWFQEICTSLLKLCIKEKLFDDNNDLFRVLTSLSVSSSLMLTFVNHINETPETKYEFVERALAYNKYTNCVTLWCMWAKYETSRDNIGDISKENSARWILKQGSNYCSNSPEIWLTWSQLEIQENNIGDISKEYSARWILKHGTDCCNDASIWFAWSQLEIQENNIGDISEEYSARWIFKQGAKCDDDASIWLAWSQLEIQENNIGDISKKHSARWVLNKSTEYCSKDVRLWYAWLKLEVNNNNIGDENTEYSARWIFNKALENNSTFADIWTTWNDFENKESVLYQTVAYLKHFL